MLEYGRIYRRMMTSFCVPERLIMRPAKCRYCSAEHDFDIEVGDREGIRTCTRHKPDAERDCNAHLHKTCLVRLRDARTALATFFDALPETFSVIRTSGEIDPGWKVPFDVYELQFVSKIRDVDWGIPVIKGTGETATTKAVRLTDFLKPALQIPGLTADVIHQSLATLDAGVYKADVDAQDRMGVMADTEPDHPYMQILQLPTGELVRGFVPPS
jgi:hypothetical protein